MRTLNRGLVVCITAVFFLTGQCEYAARAEDAGSIESYGLSDDPRLLEPKENFSRAIELNIKGHEEFARRPGEAQRIFEHAEDYSGKAAFLYKELGEKNGIDVSHEVAACERFNREVHVWVGKARKARKRMGSGM